MSTCHGAHARDAKVIEQRNMQLISDGSEPAAAGSFVSHLAYDWSDLQAGMK